METCICHRLYRVSKPTVMREYAFSGSLCRIREFETLDGLRYCITIFSLSNYKKLHFPHDEYKMLMCKIPTLLSVQTIAIFNNSTWLKSNESKLSVELIPFNDDFKIKFGIYHLTIGPVTAFGLLKTTPFTSDHFAFTEEKPFTCDSKWDICVCKSCPIFKRLVDFELTVKSNSKIANIVY